jgi:chromosome segregation protein
MYLKSLDINGFKSFAEKTNIQLSEEVNVIVGPNGSGKSNVVDAISWVLGTQSPASLRTNKMEDVIFAGTEKLAEKGFAEVYLNFEVDEKIFNGNSEISIGRKLFRDGTSEYFMNGLNCRLLDIQEFLSDVGIGKQQHIIISQGQIAEILNSKPEDHRLTIEEASGILPLRSKKERSLKRIESGDKEIKRAKDVLREIKKQLKPLQEQAGQAKLHEDTTNQLKENNVKLNVLLYKNIQQAINALDETDKRITFEISNTESKIKSLKAEKYKFNNNLGDGISIGSTFKDYSSKINNITEQLRSIAQVANERKDNLDREDFKNLEQVNKITKKIEQNTNQISSLSTQLVSKQYTLKNLQSTYDDLKNNLESVIKKSSASIEVNEALLETEIKTLQKNINEASGRLNTLSEDLRKWQNDVSKSEGLLIELNNDLYEANIFLESKNRYVEFNNGILDREILSKNNNIDKLNQHKDSIKNQLIEKQELLSGINENESFKLDINNQKNNLENQISEIEKQISAVSNQLVSSQERIKTLTEQNIEFNYEKENIASNKNTNSKDELSNLVGVVKTYINFTNKASELLDSKSDQFDSKYGNTNKKIQSIDNEIEELSKNYYEYKDLKTSNVIKLSENQNQLSNHYSTLKNIYGLSEEWIKNCSIEGLNQNELQNQIKLNESELEKIGTVNYLARDDFESLNERFNEITKNIDDLKLAKIELVSHIKEIENEIEFRIQSSFNSISVHFSEIFETLFPGGKGSLSFTDKENILETGIDISVQPKGKKVKKLSLLSGGERSLAAIAFLFSIFKSFPSPFYILDEVEAALDDANLHRMINLLKHVKNDAQYIIVTHQQQTMHAGDVLYGVTMEPGSGSRVFIKTKADFEALIKNHE